MSSRYIKVTNEEDLKKYHEARLLHWKYVKGDGYLEETQPWETLLAAWECRTNWDSYVIVEKD